MTNATEIREFLRDNLDDMVVEASQDLSPILGVGALDNETVVYTDFGGEPVLTTDPTSLDDGALCTTTLRRFIAQFVMRFGHAPSFRESVLGDGFAVAL